MTKVIFRRNSCDHIIFLEIKGHAKAGRKGYDIVCAAVSALTQTAILGLDKYLNKSIDYKISEGFLTLSLKAEPDEKTDAILETILLGLQEIAKAYEKNLKIEQVGGEYHV